MTKQTHWFVLDLDGSHVIAIITGSESYAKEQIMRLRALRSETLTLAKEIIE